MKEIILNLAVATVVAGFIALWAFTGAPMERSGPARPNQGERPMKEILLNLAVATVVAGFSALCASMEAPLEESLSVGMLVWLSVIIGQMFRVSGE